MSPENADGGGLAARLSGRRGAFSLDLVIRAPPGLVTALVGPSGSGKSTLLRALAGLERLDGEVALGGEVWQDARRFIAPHRRAVGFVFQQSALLAHLSVRANLAYAARRSGADQAAFDRVSRLLGLAPLLARAPGALSGGERQRVALGRALLTRPRLLLLDEPLSGLDAAAKIALLPALREVFASLAIPIVYVSHDAVEVARVADLTLRIAGGRVDGVAPDGHEDLAGLSPERIAALAAAALRAGLNPSEGA